ncbi:hypothetical protein HOD08_01450 [bacterium]|nr:hypothetical protein [bacterium]
MKFFSARLFFLSANTNPAIHAQNGCFSRRGLPVAESHESLMIVVGEISFFEKPWTM